MRQTRRSRSQSNSPFGSFVNVIMFAMVCMLLLYAFALIKYIYGQFEVKANTLHQELFLSNTHDFESISESIRDRVPNNHISNVIPPSNLRNVKPTKATPNGELESSPILGTILEHNKSSVSTFLEPNDLVTAVVQCSTTQGNITIDVRGSWSPRGSEQFLTLVDKKLFSDLPFFRVCPRYIAQFGVKYKYEEKFSVIEDDPSLWGVRDMDFGYMFFAGSGRNSRHSQMVVALCDALGCKTSALGKADWEVPVGTVRRQGFGALVDIEKSGFPYPRLEMGGQDPNAAGPNQMRIRSDPDYLSSQYPFVQFWRECHVERRYNPPVERPLYLDHASPVLTESMLQRFPTTDLKKHDHSVFVEMLVVVNGDNNGGKSHNLAQRVVIEVMPEWAPLGAQRFVDLVNSLYFDGASFFRVIKKFMAQFGIAASPDVSAFWRPRVLVDDPVVASNKRGTVSFAMSGKNTRTTQLFINYGDNSFLDKQGFAPIGRVVEGMDVMDQLYNKYGEGGSGDGRDGRGPNQGRINRQGKAYLEKVFPQLSFIKFATIIDDGSYLPPTVKT